MTEAVADMSPVARAVSGARDVRRPDADSIGVGQVVVVYGPRVRKSSHVVRVGRTLIEVAGMSFPFDRDTLRARTGSGTQWRIKTAEQDVYDLRMDAARARLRRAGVALSAVQPPPDGHVLAYAALARLLAEGGE